MLCLCCAAVPRSLSCSPPLPTWREPCMERRSAYGITCADAAAICWCAFCATQLFCRRRPGGINARRIAQGTYLFTWCQFVQEKLNKTEYRKAQQLQGPLPASSLGIEKQRGCPRPNPTKSSVGACYTSFCWARGARKALGTYIGGGLLRERRRRLAPQAL